MEAVSMKLVLQNRDCDSMGAELSLAQMLHRKGAIVCPSCRRSTLCPDGPSALPRDPSIELWAKRHRSMKQLLEVSVFSSAAIRWRIVHFILDLTSCFTVPIILLVVHHALLALTHRRGVFNNDLFYLAFSIRLLGIPSQSWRDSYQ